MLLSALRQALNVSCNGKMTTRNFISRLNWRQILIHFIATWFFVFAFQTLFYLNDIKLIDIIRQSGQENITKALNANGTSTSDLLNFTRLIGVGSTVGLLVAFIISLTISIKRHWFWVNSVIVLVATYFLNWFGLLGWTSLKQIFLTPGQIFANTILEFLVNAIFLLTLGLLMFFLRRPTEFIDRNNVGIA